MPRRSACAAGRPSLRAKMAHRQSQLTIARAMEQPSSSGTPADEAAIPPTDAASSSQQQQPQQPDQQQQEIAHLPSVARTLRQLCLDGWLAAFVVAGPLAAFGGGDGGSGLGGGGGGGDGGGGSAPNEVFAIAKDSDGAQEVLWR